MDGFERYALYFLPEGELSTFGASWLGWNVQEGIAAAHPDIPGLPAPTASLTERPRKYGFHATIKPPFHLAKGTSASSLHEAAVALCQTLPAVILDGLELAAIGSFLALRPVGDGSALSRLAADIVRGLDRFRAPPGIGELARRRAAKLTRKQEAHLRDWGYPYVMDEFRFHLTLTGPLDSASLEACKTALTPMLSPLIARPYPIDSICLVGSDSDGNFHLLHRYPLFGGTTTTC